MWPQLILKVNYFPELRRGAGHDLPAWSQLLIIPRLETDPRNPSINHSSEQSAYLKFHTGKEEGDITLKNEGGTIFLDLVKTHEIRSFYPQNSVIGGRRRGGESLKRDFIFSFSPFWQLLTKSPSHFIWRKIINLISGNNVFIINYKYLYREIS